MEPLVVEEEEHAGTRRSYSGDLSKWLGAAQITIGVTCIIFQVLAIFYQAGLYVIGYGFWCGIFFIVAGSYGVKAGKNKRTGYIIASMVLSIISATVFMVPLIACAVIGFYFDRDHIWVSNSRDEGKDWIRQATHGLMLGLAVFEGIIATIASAICCGPLCCTGPTGSTDRQDHVHYDPVTGQQFVLKAGRPQYLVSSGVTSPQNIGQPPIYTIQQGMQAQPRTSTDINPPPYSPPTSYYSQTDAGIQGNAPRAQIPSDIEQQLKQTLE